jgi:hypothetical protein
MARRRKAAFGSRAVSRERKSTTSAFAKLKTFKVTTTFAVAPRLDLGNTRGYSMCIGYGRVASPQVKSLPPR